MGELPAWLDKQPDFVFIGGNEEDERRMGELRSFLDTQRVLDSYRLGPHEFWYVKGDE
jgi:hypothetical protein